MCTTSADGQLVAVVEAHALAQMHDVGRSVRLFPVRRQARPDAELVVEREQVVVRPADRPSATLRRCPTRGSKLFGDAKTATVMTFGSAAAVEHHSCQIRTEPQKTQRRREPCGSEHSEPPSLHVVIQFLLQVRQNLQRFERRRSIEVDLAEPFAEHVVGGRRAPGTARAAAARPPARRSAPGCRRASARRARATQECPAPARSPTAAGPPAAPPECRSSDPSGRAGSCAGRRCRPSTRAPRRGR